LVKEQKAVLHVSKPTQG